MCGVWMIFTIMYPFCLVELYPIKTSADNHTELADLINKKTVRTIPFLLNYGLSLMGIIFIY